MAPAATTNTKWSTGFDTARRQKLFRDTPKDRTAYPSLAEVSRPHIDSFNAVFEKDGLLDHGLKDIGTKVFLDGDPYGAHDRPRNRLSVRIREFFLDKSVLPPTNKFSTQNREIFPAECRERHATYRGRLKIRMEMRINDGDWKESVQEMGHVPLMVKVCQLLKYRLDGI